MPEHPSRSLAGLGGGAGAIIGVIHSTQAVEGWVRILAALGAAVGGAAIGLLVGSMFVALFTAPFVRRSVP